MSIQKLIIARWSYCAIVLILILGHLALDVPPVAQDLPGALPKTPQAEPAQQEEADKELAAPTADNPEATAAEAAGPIAIDAEVSDQALQERLARLLPKYPGVRKVQVTVEEGVVTLTGQVADNLVRDRLREFVRRVEGVNLILNRTKTDAQVLSAWQLAAQQLAGFWALLSQKWLLGLLALATLVLSVVLARLVWRFADGLLGIFIKNLLLRSVFESMLGALIIGGGFVLALQILGLAETVLPGLGLAGVVALAVGFAFRDITENFISSILLGARRPFRIGDYILVGDHEGVVQSLNTRATVLVTLDGYQVRIPNATVFKETVINRTASSSIRQSFDVLISYEVSTVAAQKAITDAIRAHDGVATEPPPRVLLDELESGAVRLRAYFWFTSRGVDPIKLGSDVRLRVKVALQQIGITPPPAAVTLSFSHALPLATQRQQPSRSTQRPPTDYGQSQVNLMRDTEAAQSTSANAVDAGMDPVAQALEVARDEVSAEGENLLAKARSDEKTR